MRLKITIKLCISFLLASISLLSQAAEPQLNGMAVHIDLGKEQFIGALYTSTLSDNPDKLLTSNQPMRMELKIVAPEGIATRRFSRWWIEGMAINNSPALLTEQADNMVKFDALFKGRFVANDEVAFSYEPGKGVNITVNDVFLGNIAGDKFFPMLLRTWIGKVPLSSDYKDGILKNGKVSEDIKNRFAKLKPSAARIAEVATWSKLKSPADLAAEKEKEKEAKEAAALAAAAKASSAQTSSADSAAAKLAAQKAEQAKAEAAKLAAQKAAAAAVATTTAPATSADDEDDDKPALTAQTLLARQFYVSDQLKKIYGNVRYPKRALERNQTGSVRVAIVIDRKGNVLKTSIAQASEVESLNDAALQAVGKSGPFSALPDAISGTTFEFTAPLKFTLQN
ncbi:MAG: TonB family protein [Gammaproteobacteria bacterium]|nr:MAG: TonB family protein [Gammaproteobacteria bacterium]